MNGPAPGWQPDPTGRHEYRYWDGTRWSDDVSDGGVAATDPVAGAPDASPSFGASNQVPPTTPQPGYQPGYDPSGYDSGAGTGYGSGGYAATGGTGAGVPGGPGPGGPGGPTSGGYGSGAPTPGGYGSGGYPGYGAATPPSGSGPSTGLLVGLGALVVVLIAGIVFVVLNSGDDDDTATTDETTTTTAGTDPTDPTTTAPDDGGDDGGDNSAIVSAISAGILEGAGGVLDQEEADCMAQAMVDEIGVERLIELGLEANEGGSDPLSVLTSDEQDAVYSAMLGCVDAETLGELPGG